jgi:hypothetical protein
MFIYSGLGDIVVPGIMAALARKIDLEGLDNTFVVPAVSDMMEPKVCVLICLSLYLCLLIYVYISVCKYIYTSVDVYIYIMCVDVYIYINVRKFMYIYMCRHLYMSTPLSLIP